MNFTNTYSVGKEVYTQMERQAQSKLKRWLNEVRPEYKYLYRQVSGQMCRLVFNQIYPIHSKPKSNRKSTNNIFRPILFI